MGLEPHRAAGPSPAGPGGLGPGGNNHVINSAGGQSSQQWHTLRLEFDRGNGDVVASIDGIEWYTGSAFLASLVGTDMSLYGWAGDNFTNAVCFTDWSIWTDGEVVVGE